MSAPKVEVFEDAAHQWRYRVVGGNGEPMAQSESYTRRGDAQRGADQLKAVMVALATPQDATEQDGE